jgi:hypothetical protein
VIGTDTGIYVADRWPKDKSAKPKRVLEASQVTQIDVLEEYQLLLVLANKTLTTYAMEALEPNDSQNPLVKRPKKIQGHVNFFKSGIGLGRHLVASVKTSALSTTIKVFEPMDNLTKQGRRPALSRMFQSGQDALKPFKVGSKYLIYKAASPFIQQKGSGFRLMGDDADSSSDLLDFDFDFILRIPEDPEKSSEENVLYTIWEEEEPVEPGAPKQPSFPYEPLSLDGPMHQNASSMESLDSPEEPGSIEFNHSVESLCSPVDPQLPSSSVTSLPLSSLSMPNSWDDPNILPLTETFQEFYIPAESSSVHFLRSTLCVGCARGFEVVSLETTETQSLLDQADTSLDFVQRKETIRPIHIERLNGEFLLNYSDFSFFVNRNGWRARPDWKITWEGNPTDFALSYPYILAFEQSFLEIRHVESAELIHIMTGKNIRMLHSSTREVSAKTCMEFLNCSSLTRFHSRFCTLTKTNLVRTWWLVLTSGVRVSNEGRKSGLEWSGTDGRDRFGLVEHSL